MKKLTDQEIEKQVKENLFLSGRSLGRISLLYLMKAEEIAKQHSCYPEKYQLTMDIIKSIQFGYSVR